jgi:hypothetical protein
MSKLFIILLLFFLLLLGGLGYTVISLKENNSSFKIPFQNSPTPTITTIYSLTLTPEKSTVVPGQTNTIYIMLDVQNSSPSKPQLIQMEISYNPTALFDVEITPGDFFVRPTESLKIINTNTGRISYALEATATEPLTQTDILKNHIAKITFTPNPAFSKQETALSFLGKTKIRDKTKEHILTATYGTLLFFASGSAITQ